MLHSQSQLLGGWQGLHVDLPLPTAQGTNTQEESSLSWQYHGS